MCWSLRVSAVSWAIVACLSTFLWRRNWRNDRWWAALLGFVGQVQLLEGLLWLDQGCTGLNSAASKALLVLITLEPVAHSLIALACTPRKQRTTGQRLWVACAAAFAAAFAAAALGGQGSTGDGSPVDWCSLPCSLPICGAHLRWGWAVNINDRWHVAFLLALAAPLAGMRPASHAVVGTACALATWLAARLLFDSTTVFESMWCWLAICTFAVPLTMARPPVPGRAHAS